MVEAEQLPEPIFTPTTKAHEGHDVALTADEAIALVGKARYEELRDISIAIYRHGVPHGRRCAGSSWPTPSSSSARSTAGSS